MLKKNIVLFRFADSPVNAFTWFNPGKIANRISQWYRQISQKLDLQREKGSK